LVTGPVTDKVGIPSTVRQPVAAQVISTIDVTGNDVIITRRTHFRRGARAKVGFASPTAVDTGFVAVTDTVVRADEWVDIVTQVITIDIHVAITVADSESVIAVTTVTAVSNRVAGISAV
jgi:hypothetical protein